MLTLAGEGEENHRVNGPMNQTETKKNMYTSQILYHEYLNWPLVDN